MVEVHNAQDMITHSLGRFKYGVHQRKGSVNAAFTGRDVARKEEKRKCLKCGEEALAAELPGWFRSDENQGLVVR